MKTDTENFKKRLQTIFGDKYDYSKINYQKKARKMPSF